MEGRRVYTTNAEIAKNLDWLAGELRAKGEPAEAPSAYPEWKCPLCGNLFSLIDGTRTCTHNPDCLCPGMPEPLRVFRAVRDARWAAEKIAKTADSNGAKCECWTCRTERDRRREMP